MTDFAALQRLISGADPLQVLRYRNERGRGRQVEEEAPELPADPIEFIRRFVFWPHISQFDEAGSPRAVGGAELNSMQLDYLERRTAFRYDKSGQPIGSAGDLVGKARRIRFSSLCYGLILHTMLRLPGVAALTVFQAQKAALLEGCMDQLLFAMRRLPRQWLGLAEGEDPSELRVGYRFRFRNSSRWGLDTAGQHARVSATLGRGQTLQVLHLTEPRAYHEPEIVFASAGKAVGPNGWIVAESNPPTSRTAWMSEEYLLTAQDPPSGSFRRAFFWPWHHDPLKRIPAGTTGFQAMHNPAFVDSLPPGTLQEEIELGLDPEQIAFRRRERSTGTKLQRKLNLAENPESVSEAFSESETKRWLDPDAIAKCRLMVSDPIERYRLGTLHSVSYWRTKEEVRSLNEQVIVFVDTAAKHGVDRSAAVFRSAHSCTYLAEIHGKCLASEMADSIAHVLEKLLGDGVIRRPTRYLVAVERNAGTGRDLIDHLRNRHNMRVGVKNGLYSEQISDRRPQAQKGQRRLRPGIYTGAQTRSSYLAALSDSVEGRGFDPLTGEVLELGPQVEFRSSFALDEIEELAEFDGMIQAPSGLHDDLAIADAGCLMLCAKFGKKTGGGGFSSGGSRRSLKSFSRSAKKAPRSRTRRKPRSV